MEAKKNKAQLIAVADAAYYLTIDALTLLGNSAFEFSMKRREMLKSEVAPGFKSLCRDSQPITFMLFGDELPQSIRELFGDELPQSIRDLFGNELPQSIRELFGDELPPSIRDILQVERMAAKCVNSSKRKGYGQQLSQSYNKRRNYGESPSSDRMQQKLERLSFELIAPESPQISSRAALTESGPQEKRSKSCLTLYE